MIRAPEQYEVTAELAALHLHRCGARIKPATIRQWASRGHIHVIKKGHACYDLREVEKHARTRGLIAE